MDFWQIYNDYYQPVRSFIAAMIKDDWAADDLVQETFIKVEEKLDTLKDPARVKSWVFSVARNTCLDHFRKAKSISRHEDQGNEMIQGIQRSLVQKQLEQHEMSRCVRDKMDLLAEPHRTVLILFDFMELSHEEIADVLEITVGAAKVRLHRARKAMKEILRQHCTFEHDERNVLVCLPTPEKIQV